MATSDPHNPTGSAPAARPNLISPEGAARAFTTIERLFLVLIAVMTCVAAAVEIYAVVSQRAVTLADILLMFLYLEVIGMIAVFYEGTGSPFIYPIFIAMTALARLIVLQGKDMAPENIVFEAGAILLLSIAAAIVARSWRASAHGTAPAAPSNDPSTEKKDAR